MKAIQVGIRFPAEMKRWLERQARLNRSSQNSEVVRAVRAMMEAAGVQFGDHAPAAGKAQEMNQHKEPHHANE